MAADQQSRFSMAHALWLGYVAVVCALSLWPMPPGPSTGHWDKVVHLVLYLIMGLSVPWPVRDRAWRSLAALTALGVGLEILQETMGLGRNGDVLDALSNGVGAALGLALRLRRVGRPAFRSAREDG